MGSCLEETSYSTINSQITSGSRSSLLISRVEFEANDDDEDDLMSAKTLQTKYNVLKNDDKVIDNNNNNHLNTKSNDNVIKLNGQLGNKLSVNSVSQMNGNSCNTNYDNNGQPVGDGLVAAKHVLFSRERVVLDWKERLKIGVGFTNLGNTCFLNSVLQCLTYCPPLVNYLMYANDHNPNRCNQVNQNMFCMVCEMAHIIKLARSSHDSVKPLNVCRRLKSIAKHFQFGRQEDAHEFLRYVVDNMWKSCLNYNDAQRLKLDPKSKETTAINQIFGGYHRSQVQCLQCKSRSNTYDYFMDFMIDIKNVSTLEKALEKFTTPDILQDENSYKCPRCKRKVVARKQFTIHTAPNVATFQLKRFEYQRIFGGKITKTVTYPERLNLRPYMSDSKGPPIFYKLNSVLVHLGPSCNSGHYFCYVRNSNNVWYCMDDSRTLQVNLHQALSQQAYVLFYVRVDTDFHKPAPVINGLKMKSNLGLSPELAPNHRQIFNDKFKFNAKPTALPMNANAVQSEAKAETNQLKRKQINSKSMMNNNNSNHITKGLVPYPSDSSDEDNSNTNSPKPVGPTMATTRVNGGLNHTNNSYCDKSINNNNNYNTNRTEPSVKCPQKLDKLENIRIKTNTNQIIPKPNPINPKLNQKSITNLNNNLQNHTSKQMETIASNSVPSVAPITLKVKATTSSWQVVETCALRSPSITSNSSTNSVNSTTEWTVVSDCKSDMSSGGQRKSHKKHRNKQLNGCTAAAMNGNVTPVLSAKHRTLSLNGHEIGAEKTGQNPSISVDVNTSAGFVYNRRNSCEDKSYLSKSTADTPPKRLSPKKGDSKSTETNGPFMVTTADGDYRPQNCTESDRRSSGSHRSSNDSIKEHKKRDKSHSKSANNSDVDTDNDHEVTAGASNSSHHKHEKRKKRKHSRDERSSGESDADTDDKIVTKHKKKKKHKKKTKKKKHRKRHHSESSSSAGNESDVKSDDNDLQWVERTKETVERERDVTIQSGNSSKSDPLVKQWDENVRDLAKKRRLDDQNHPLESVPTVKTASIIPDNDDNTVNGLLKANHRGFGDKVNSWSGGPSCLDSSLSEDKQRYVYNDDDDYNDEFDMGKTKKVKTKHEDKHRNHHEMNGVNNPFQKISSDFQRFNGTLDRNLNYNKHEFPDNRSKDGNKQWDNGNKSWTNNSYHNKRYDHHNSERRH